MKIFQIILCINWGIWAIWGIVTIFRNDNKISPKELWSLFVMTMFLLVVTISYKLLGG